MSEEQARRLAERLTDKQKRELLLVVQMLELVERVKEAR